MELYCGEIDKKVKWTSGKLKDKSTGKVYDVYVCRKCVGRKCYEDKILVDIGGTAAKESGDRIGRALANMVSSVYPR